VNIQITTLRALLGLSTALGLAAPALAQTAANPAPPTRVGQIAAITGSVSFNGAASNGAWTTATLNYPLTTGDTLFTQPGGQAAIALDASRLTLGPNTELQITSLDDQNFTATESQGELFLHLTELAPGQNFTVATPRGNVTVTGAAELDIAAGDAGTPTTVAVLAGSADIGGTTVAAGQEAELTGTNPVSANLVPMQSDAFMTHLMTQMAPPPPPYAPQAVAQMTGINELAAYGSWDQSPEYGAVWYPNVSPGWAPFREGHWAYIAPWGWTWVDNEPWGFAPFHYGRWIDHGGRWGWVPVAYADGYAEGVQPVYAPAVVSFFGLGAGVAITAAVLSSGSVGWVPLGPGEAYYPPYRVSPDYLHRINRIEVRNYVDLHVDNHVDFNHYANLRGATYIRAAEMAHGDPVGHDGHPVPHGMLQQAHPVGADFDHALRPEMAHPAAPPPHLTDFARTHEAPMHPGMAPAHEHAPQVTFEHGPAHTAMPQERAPAPPGMHPQEPQPHQMQPHEMQPHQIATHEMAPRAEPHELAPQHAAPHEMQPHQMAPHEMAPRAEPPHRVAPHEPAPQHAAPHEMAPHPVPQRAMAPRPMARPEVHSAPHPAPHPQGGHPDQQDQQDQHP
jgi:hypothetical protein